MKKAPLYRLFSWARRRGPLALLLVLLAVALRCDSTPSSVNASSLWIGIAQREIDLVLIDHEPPPF
jgi:hypothetical protein